MRKTVLENERTRKYWDYEKNIGLDPKKIRCGSAKKVWWKCENNHSYVCLISSKVSGKMCELCKENKILPTEITKKYGKRLLWECKKKHS